MKYLACLTLSCLPVWKAQASILPPNDLYLEDNPNLFFGINESDFNTIVTKIVDIYQPIVKLHGAKLTPNMYWSDSTVNASAVQFGIFDWRINMYGGLARRPEITRDGFALVVCHELGHHLGGFPFYPTPPWPAAVEGQADYFATQSCLKEVWRSEKATNQQARDVANELEIRTCAEAWSNSDDQNLCIRSLHASESMSALLAALRSAPAPRIDTPDESTVDRTFPNHPEAQCRLDTYVQGALCQIPFDRFFIPGKKQVPLDSLNAETEALDRSCAAAGGDTKGNRPHCWFAPALKNLGVRAFAFTPASLSHPDDLKLLKVRMKNRSLQNSQTTKVDFTTASYGTPASHTFLSVPLLDANQEFVADLSVPSTNLICGETLNISAKQENSSVLQNFYLDIGRKDLVIAGARTVSRSIPDNSETGVHSTIVSGIAKPAVGAQVYITINHPIPSDLSFVLTAPSGKTYPGRFSAAPRTQKDFEFNIPLKEVQSQGDWQLLLKDGSNGDTGEFVSWKLNIVVGSCRASR